MTSPGTNIVTSTSTSTGTTAAPLRVSELTLRFGGLTALDGIDFEVPAGQLLAVLGPNGAGKSSLFNCINGVYTPSDGRVFLNGEDVTDRRPHERASRGLARTFQNLALFNEMTVLENLMAARSHQMRTGVIAGLTWFGRARRDELEHREPVERTIDFLGLGRYRHEKVAALSYGWRKRIELGRALCMDPQVLLLDEPLAGMNDAETREIVDSLLDVRERLGLTMVLVEHNLGVVLEIADRVLVLDFGRQIADGTPDEVAHDPAVVAAYVGERRASL